MTVIKHKSEGKTFSVQEHLKGKRSEYSLCWQDCKKFKPNNVQNCKIAQDLAMFAMINGVKTAVWECTSYEKKEEKK